MLAWLLACLFLTSQLPDSSGASNGAVRKSDTPRIWIQVAENGNQTETNLKQLTVQTFALPEVGAAQFDLVFNPEQMQQPELVAGSLLSNALLESNFVSPGRLRIAFVSSDPISGSGELVILRDLNQEISPKGELDVRLENVKAWKSADSSEVGLELSAPPPTGPAKAVAKPSSSQTNPQATTFSPSSNPLPQVAHSSDTVTLAQSTPLQVQVQLTLPGWFTFAAGALTTLVVGSLLLLLARKP